VKVARSVRRGPDEKGVAKPPRRLATRLSWQPRERRETTQWHLCWLLGTSVRQVDGFVLVFLIYLQLSFFTDEGVQEHFAYLQAFAKAIFFLSGGDREKVCFKHAKNNTVARSTQSSQVLLLRW
jgi:hypothetical protein